MSLLWKYKLKKFFSFYFLRLNFYKLLQKLPKEKPLSLHFWVKEWQAIYSLIEPIGHITLVRVQWAGIPELQ